MLHPIKVALETDAERVGLLQAGPPAGADRTRRTRCEGRIQLGLTLLAPAYPATDEVATFMSLANRELISPRLVQCLVDVHRARVTTGCDSDVAQGFGSSCQRSIQRSTRMIGVKPTLA